MPSENSIADKTEALNIICQISELLNTGLSRDKLSICVRLIEAGVNPDALAVVVKDLSYSAAKSKRSDAV